MEKRARMRTFGCKRFIMQSERKKQEEQMRNIFRRSFRRRG